MGVKTLFVTINSAMDLKAPRDDVYLVVSLSGDQKQRAPVNKKKGSTNPWSGHTFSFAVDEAAVLACCLKFEIKKAKGIIGLKKGIFCLKKGIGQVDVPLKDLLGEGGASDGKPKVMSRAVTSSSKETVSVLHFSYEFSQQFPIEVPSADEPVTGDPTAAAPSASNSAPSYPPPAPGVVQYTQLTDLANAALPAYAHPPAGHAARSFMGMLMVRFAVEALMSMLE